MNRKLPLLNELIKYHKENNLILSMPGNKCGKAFERDEIGKIFSKNLGYLDITEVDPLDNLHNPEGIIKEAQDLLKDYYGTKKAYFMVNGSTNGNLAAIFSVFEEGDEVLVERNCHRSVYNAIVLKKLKVTYIEPSLYEAYGMLMPPTEMQIFDALKRSTNPKGIILTYPNYYGVTYDIQELIIRLKANGLKVIIDGAHGAHFNSTDKLPKSITKLADYIVLSAHKTLPALTSGAYLLVNCEDRNIDFYVSTFMTTSPSYLIMASLDYARYYLESYGKEDYEKLIDIASYWREKINSLGKVKILSRKDFNNAYDIDESRYVITVDGKYNGHLLLDYFRKNHIQCEMSYNQGVVMILSPSNTNEDFEEIYNAINKLCLSEIESKEVNINVNIDIPKKLMEPFEVFSSKYEELELSKCEGRVSKEFIIPYPPGIPVVCPGEIIDNKIIELINRYISNKKTVIGLNSDKKCKVIL